MASIPPILPVKPIQAAGPAADRPGLSPPGDPLDGRRPRPPSGRRGMAVVYLLVATAGTYMTVTVSRSWATVGVSPLPAALGGLPATKRLSCGVLMAHH